MDSHFSTVFLVLFPVLFVGVWFWATTGLMARAGWFDLARLYPDRDDPALLRLRFQSGRMSGVSLNQILCLEACRSGLRVSMPRYFAPFCRNFLVPWTDIQVMRKNGILWRGAELTFGGGPRTLVLMDHVANRLARAVPGLWPESGTFARETAGQVAWICFKAWLLNSLCAAVFFTVVPRLAFPNLHLPLAGTIGLPACLLALAALAGFSRRMEN